MVVVQIFTFVLTTALLRHSERTISPAPSARFGGPRLAPGHQAGAPLALPVRHSANAIGQELVHGMAISRTRGWKTMSRFCFTDSVVLSLLSNRQFSQQVFPAH